MTWHKVLKDGVLKDGDLYKANIEGKEILIIKDGADSKARHGLHEWCHAQHH